MLFLPMGTASVDEVLCFLVAVPSAWDLLLCAKHLSVDAKASGVSGRRFEKRHHHATKVQ